MLRFRKIAWTFLPLALFALVVSGCGVAASDAASKEVKVPDWIRNNAEWWSEGIISDDEFHDVPGDPGLTTGDATDVSVGNVPGSSGPLRGYMRFDLSALDGKTISSARLEVTQSSHSNLPWSTLGGLTLTRVDMRADQNYAAVLEDILSHSRPLSDGETVSWDVTGAVRADLADDQRADFRLAFPDSMPTGFYVRFHGLGSESSPRLVIQYLD